MWCSCWYSRWTTWSWWRFHFRAIVSGARHTSSGVKCHRYLCHDFFLVHVCCRILPSKTFSNSLCSLFCCCVDRCCLGQHVVRKIINILGRVSLIIFILAFTIFVSAISLGGRIQFCLGLGACLNVCFLQP